MNAPLTVVELARASHTGLVRGHNEDRFMATPPLIAVADGMGGAQAGEVAAATAVERLEALGGEVDAGALRGAVEDANRRIRAMAEANPAQAGMGTTLTAALIRDGHADLVHVGDSRAYLLRGGELRRLTEDHSLVAELVRRGELAPDEAERHPNRNVITRALGAEATIEVDQIGLDLQDGDVLLLCTDGLSAYVPEDEVRDIVATAPRLQQAADALVARANRAGGIDNTTVVLVRLGRVDPAALAATQAVPAVEATQPLPAQPPAGPGEERPRAAERAIRTVRVPASPRPAPPARVLERVDGRRSRRGPIAVGVAAALLLLAGGVVWIGSRTYFVEAAPDGTVRVSHGFPWSPAGVDLFEPWQGTGVAAADVRAADPGVLDRSARGQGEAVELAARLVWRFGVPDIEPLPAPASTEAVPRA